MDRQLTITVLPFQQVAQTSLPRAAVSVALTYQIDVTKLSAVLTAVADTYVSIPVLSGVIPFASGYERFWLGLGAISFDLMLAMIITSLVRGRLNRILWRAIHLLAYLCWPVAFAHSIGSSKDLQHGWLLDLSIACALVVAAAVLWRLASAARQLPRAARVAAILTQHGSHGARQASERTVR